MSATNCARLYDIAEVRCNPQDQDWQFRTSPTTEEVWDAFVILALLDGHQRCGSCLHIPHDNCQKDRYTVAMRARNEHIIMHGQDELPHACHGCMRVFHMPNGTTRYTEVVVTDGVTVGRPCCAVPHCKNTLESTRHRFCSADPSHKQRETTCAVEGCNKPVVRDENTGKCRKACADPVHLKMEDIKAASMRGGKSKSQRMKTAKLNDALTSTGADEEALPVQDVDEWFNHNPSTGNVNLVQASSSSSTGVMDSLPSSNGTALQVLDACPDKDEASKLKATFFRQRTNNEQLFIRPCGVISGRGTMYHHEAVSNVLVCCFRLHASLTLIKFSRFCSRKHFLSLARGNHNTSSMTLTAMRSARSRAAKSHSSRAWACVLMPSTTKRSTKPVMYSAVSAVT